MFFILGFTSTIVVGLLVMCVLQLAEINTALEAMLRRWDGTRWDDHR